MADAGGSSSAASAAAGGAGAATGVGDAVAAEVQAIIDKLLAVRGTRQATNMPVRAIQRLGVRVVRALLIL